MEEESKEGFKRCSKCGRILPITEFSKDKSIKDGLCCCCKDCTKEYHAEWYQSHRAYERKRVAEWRAKNPTYNADYNADYRDPQKNPMGWAKSMVNSYRQMDRERGFDDSKTITSEWFLENIAYQPCAHCGVQGIGKVGCNRLDNTKGHTIDNVESCCFKCNCKENNRDQLERGLHISQIRKKIAFSDFVKEHLMEKSKK